MSWWVLALLCWGSALSGFMLAGILCSERGADTHHLPARLRLVRGGRDEGEIAAEAAAELDLASRLGDAGRPARHP